MGTELALTEKQRVLVDAILSGAEPEDAKTLAGYSQDSSIWIILASRSVQKAIGDACDAKLFGPLRHKALATLEELLGTGTPAATRFQAAKFIAERSQAQDGADKPLSKMTEAELMAVIDKAKAVRDAPMKDVTPSNGA